MKKFLMIAVAALALMACGEKNKYDAALDEYETLTNKTVEAIKEGNQDAAEALDRKFNELSATLQEIEKEGTEEQKARYQEITVKFATALFGPITPDNLDEAEAEVDETFEELGEQIDDAIDKITDAND